MSAYNELRKSVRSAVGRIKSPLVNEVMCAVRGEVRQLAAEGKIQFGEDRTLTDMALECRVKQLLETIGFRVRAGRDGREDWVVECPDGAEPETPLVVEVKSSRKPNVSRDDLRQLDDWVYDLSGEHVARKRGLGGGADMLSVGSGGMFTTTQRHPSPHKGVLVFNGPVVAPFDKRAVPCVAPNDQEFVEKRNFCVIPFSVLISYARRCSEDRSVIGELWQLVHTTGGIIA